MPPSYIGPPPPGFHPTAAATRTLTGRRAGTVHPASSIEDVAQRAQTALARRLWSVLGQRCTNDLERGEAAMELCMLQRLQGALAFGPGADALAHEAFADWAAQLPALADDLQAGGPNRGARLAAYLRELAGELRVMRGAAAGQASARHLPARSEESRLGAPPLAGRHAELIAHLQQTAPASAPVFSEQLALLARGHGDGGAVALTTASPSPERKAAARPVVRDPAPTRKDIGPSK